MRPEALLEARDWQERGHRDLDAAARILLGAHPLPAIAVYHAQQAAEKALKALLAAHDRVVPRTHDREPLGSACAEIEPDMGGVGDAARILTPYAMQFRYPGSPPEPELAEAEAAVTLAQPTLQFVRAQLGLH